MNSNSDSDRPGAPRQARSRASLERLLAATCTLLETRTFEEVSVAEIARRARSSVGVFYSRFPDKGALLDHLDERYAGEVVTRIAAWCEGVADGERLAERVSGVVAVLVSFHAERRGMLRALVVAARRRRDGVFAERTRRMNAAIPALLATLLECRDEIGHPDPERAVALGFLMALTTLREALLFAEGPASIVPLADDELAVELTRAWLAYLSPRTGGVA